MSQGIIHECFLARIERMMSMTLIQGALQGLPLVTGAVGHDISPVSTYSTTENEQNVE